MYPQLINQANRLAPYLLRFLNRGGGLASGPSPGFKAGLIDAPEVTASPVAPAVPNGPAPPISGPQSHEPQPPAPPISSHNGGPTNYSGPAPIGPLFNPFAPPSLGGTAPRIPEGLQRPAAPPVVAQTPQAVPQPQARPAAAPQAEEMPWWKRNALLMQDPNGGGYIDPIGAQRAGVTGPQLIEKMMGYLHNKG